MSAVHPEQAVIDYEFGKSSKIKIFFLALIIIFCSFIYYFPFLGIVENQLKMALTTNPSCPINYKDLKFDLFFPKIILNNINISGRCVNNSFVKLDHAKLHFRGFSLSPIGPFFKVETSLKKKPFSLYAGVGFSSATVKIEKQTLNLTDLKEILPVGLVGKVKVSSKVNMNYKKGSLSDLYLNVESKNFIIPSQNIQGFDLPTFNIKNLLILGQSKSEKEFTVKKLIVGDKDSPLRMDFKGPLKVNSKMFNYSTLDLDGKFTFSKEFIESPIGGILTGTLGLDQFDKQDNFYLAQLVGPLSMPALKKKK